MATFLIIAVAGTILVALALVWPLVTGGGGARGRDAADAELYRDQLTELDRDTARGTITEAEADGARVEIARRLIAATKRAEAGDALTPAPVATSRMTAIVALIAAPALAGLIYLQTGAPGTPDLPLAARGDPANPGVPTQAEAERIMAEQLPPPEPLDPEYAALLQRLERIVAERPDDIQGLRFLARGLARAGRWGRGAKDP